MAGNTENPEIPDTTTYPAENNDKGEEEEEWIEGVQVDKEGCKGNKEAMFVVCCFFCFYVIIIGIVFLFIRTTPNMLIIGRIFFCLGLLWMLILSVIGRQYKDRITKFLARLFKRYFNTTIVTKVFRVSMIIITALSTATVLIMLLIYILDPRARKYHAYSAALAVLAPITTILFFVYKQDLDACICGMFNAI